MHPYAEVSISIRDQRCSKRYVTEHSYSPSAWARSPNRRSRLRNSFAADEGTESAVLRGLLCAVAWVAQAFPVACWWFLRVAWCQMRHGSGGGRGRVPAGCAGPVEDHRCGGREDRGCGGDEGDLPAGHAAGDDGVDLGRGWGVPGTVGARGCRAAPTGPMPAGAARAAGAALQASTAAARPVRMLAARRMEWMGFIAAFLGSLLHVIVSTVASGGGEDHTCRPTGDPQDLPAADVPGGGCRRALGLLAGGIPRGGALWPGWDAAPEPGGW